MTVRVMEGHVLDVLRSLPANTFQCVATSPPYYGLRDYDLPPQVWGGEPDHEHTWSVVVKPAANGIVNGAMQGETLNGTSGTRKPSTSGLCACGAWLGSLGLEPTPELYVEHLVSVFREVRRVLRPDGVCWVNLGDSYAGSGAGGGGNRKGNEHGQHDALSMIGRPETPSGCKPKDLLGMPWMVAFALRADGWYLRAEIIWSKPNPMPESVTDRPTKAHETVFLLSKQRTYFYGAAAIREPNTDDMLRRAAAGHTRGMNGKIDISRHDAASLRGEHTTTIEANGRNKRSVWEIATAPFPSAHFATFPPKLVEPMLLAGTSEKGCCPACGAPWERVTSTAYVKSPVHGPGSVVGRHYETGANGWDASGVPRLNKEVTTTGWRPTCAHDAAPVPCQVLDPFGGAGTTGLVADRLGRDCTLVELNPEYASMARERIVSDAPLFVDVA